MPRLELSRRAADELERLTFTHSLPADTKGRARRSIEPLRRFPLFGAPLGGPWSGFRFLLGPWRWLVVVYEYREDEDRVVVVTIQDARSSRSPSSGRRG